MIENLKVLAVVPARSGSKGVPDKNMQVVGGRSLIGRAGVCLQNCRSVDRAVISTDSERYAREGQLHGLEAPFLRPPGLSDDTATAVDTMTHALLAAEEHYGERFDIALMVEPTCPLRTLDDVEGALRMLIETGVDSVVSVSRVDTKFHPHKQLRLEGQRLSYYDPAGASVTARQSLGPLYYRNGACYALTRKCLLEEKVIIGKSCAGYLIDRWLVNIDEPIEIEFTRFLIEKAGL